MEQNRKTVGFVILTWNSEKYIRDCVLSINNLNGFEKIISICDNGSTDQTISILDEFKNLIITRFDYNKGTTVSRNAAIKALPKCDYICVLDSDTQILDNDGFLSMISELESNERIGIIGPELISPNGELQYSGRNIPTRREKMYKASRIKFLVNKGRKMEHVDYDTKKNIFCVGYLMSACWLFKSELINKIGYLDEKIFYAPEDVEFCMRTWANNLLVVYYRNCKVIHHWQRISRRKMFSKHNFEHIKGLRYIRKKYDFKLIRTKVKQDEIDSL